MTLNGVIRKGRYHALFHRIR